MLTPAQNIHYMIAAGFILFLSVSVIVAGIIIVHDIPYKVAKKRNNPQKDAIRCMSILGLIAFPLWLFSMIWAYMKTSPKSNLPLNFSNEAEPESNKETPYALKSEKQQNIKVQKKIVEKAIPKTRQNVKRSQQHQKNTKQTTPEKSNNNIEK